MANLKSEQIRSDLSLDINADQPLSTSEMTKNIENLLGKENCFIERILNKNYYAINITIKLKYYF